MEVAIDAGRKRSYVVVQDGNVVKEEGYVDTNTLEFLSVSNETTFILEAGRNLYPIVEMLEKYPNSRIVVAHPTAMKLIANAPNKTDKNDTHKLLSAYNAKYLPTAWLPPKDVREDRNLCSARSFFVKQRAAIKNRVRYEAQRYGVELGSLTKRTFESLKESEHLTLRELSKLHAEYDGRISNFDKTIDSRVPQNHYAELIDTIPGIGKVSALSIASQIGDIHRFRTEFNFFSYIGLCPSTHQSGDIEWKGHVKSGNVSLRSLMIECTWLHIAFCKESFVTHAYYKLAARMGPKKAAIACAKRLARIIYYMLIRDKTFNPYGVGR